MMTNVLASVVFTLVFVISTSSAEVCSEPSWFIPYGEDEGDFLISNPQDSDTTYVYAPSELDYNGFGTHVEDGDIYVSVEAGSSGQIKITSNSSQSGMGATFTLHAAYPPETPYSFNGVESGVFIRGTEEPNLLGTITADINSAFSLVGSPFGEFQAAWVAVVTLHCVVRASDNKPNTIQAVIAIDENYIFTTLQFDKLSIPIGSIEGPGTKIGLLSDGPYYPFVSDMVDSRMDSHYLTMTNAGRPGRWAACATPWTPVFPATVNGWGERRCSACGGCGIRSRIKDGVKEWDYGICNPMAGRCRRGYHTAREWIPSSRRRGYSIGRKRRCCIKYPVGPPGSFIKIRGPPGGPPGGPLIEGPTIIRPTKCGLVGGWGPTGPL